MVYYFNVLTLKKSSNLLILI